MLGPKKEKNLFPRNLLDTESAKPQLNVMFCVLFIRSGKFIFERRAGFSLFSTNSIDVKQENSLCLCIQVCEPIFGQTESGKRTKICVDLQWNKTQSMCSWFSSHFYLDSNLYIFFSLHNLVFGICNLCVFVSHCALILLCFCISWKARECRRYSVRVLCFVQLLSKNSFLCCSFSCVCMSYR